MSGNTTQIQPLSYGKVLTAASVQVIGPNPTRAALTMHNPNAIYSIWVAPIGTTAAPNGAGSFQIFPGADRDFNGAKNATCGWNACMDAGQTGNMSILEWPSNP